MIDIGIDKLKEKTSSVYKLANLAVRRAYELSQGSNKLVDVDPKTKASVIALKEICEGKISYKEKKEKKD